MRVLSLVHGLEGRPGTFGQAVLEAGHELDERSFIAGPPPAPPDRYDAAMIFGGSMNVHEERDHPWIVEEKRFVGGLLERDIPVLGVCLGAQLVAAAAGAAVARARSPEVGWYDVELTPDAGDDALFREAPDRFTAFEWHSYEFALPPGALPLAYTPVCLQAYRLRETAWGIQFHAEVTKEIVESWIAAHGTDADAVRAGFDPPRERLRLEAEIDRWVELGRAFADAFLDVAGARLRSRAMPTRV
jgi:GMP synthase-like glutamine amidotransferase